MNARFPLIALAALALAACAPSGDRDERQVPAKPPGFELAMAGSASAATAETVIDLSVEQLIKARANGDIRLVDVRTDEEVAAGMIPGAEHMALADFDPAKLTSGDGRPIILYCRSGNRSRKAGEKLAAHLGQPVPHLAGGIKAWEAAGQPVVTGNN